jgi:hypothetical protein
MVCSDGNMTKSKYSKAYNNPYHPEDDGIIENISDEDGDNLKFGGKALDPLSDSEQNIVKQLQKKLKINGRYYEAHNTTDNVDFI